jgi:calcineurin-like phosphoesterase family protein
MQYWFMADTHFGHNRHKGGIVRMMSRVKPGTRQLFDSIEEHDDCIISTINGCVDRYDKLFILGDFAWDTPGKYRQQINCKQVFLVLGNHDQRAKCANIFTEVWDLKLIKVPCQGFSQKVVMCHYPMCYWQKSYSDSIHIYGHCHGMVEDQLNSLFPGRRAMDVGVDCLYDLNGSYAPIVGSDLVCTILERCNGHEDMAVYDAYQEHRFRKKTQ